MHGLERLALVALGVLAYKNRDRLGEFLSGDAPAERDPNTKTQGGVFNELAGGLCELLDRFRNAGSGDAVDSWIGTGPNRPIDKSNVEAAIDRESLDSLSNQTGMSREEILERLATDLPEVVNEITPDGRLPEAPAKPSSGSFSRE